VWIKDLIPFEIKNDTILWVTITQVFPHPDEIYFSAFFEVEDSNQQKILFCMYNNHNQVIFEEGHEIGINQPYMTITYEGNLYLRNDNPANVIFSKPVFEGIEKNGYEFLKKAAE